jgi:hypothetical protein
VTYTDETYGSGTYTVRFMPTADARGSVDPFTGRLDISVQFWAKIDSENFDFGPNCGVGSPASPISVQLTTGRTSPPPPAAPMTGSAYDEQSGRLTMVNNSVPLPKTSGCGFFGGPLDQELHLPSAAGRNSVVMVGRLQPLIVAERPPSITALGLRPRSFRTRARRRARGRLGTEVRYVLTKAATTRFRVERLRWGRRKGRSCVKATRRTRHRKRCARWLRAKGSFSRSAGPGASSFRFRGRIGGRRLPPGRYRLVAVPRDALGTPGQVRKARFTVKR